MKKVSIVTVNYNNREGLIQTIESVKRQTFNDYEYIVIDGGSDDGSRDILEKNSSLFSYWCSERDGGIYYGMNKGLSRVTGVYVLFLNSGDCFVNNKVLERVFGNADYTEDLIVGRQLHIMKSGRRSKSRRIRPEEIDGMFFFGNTLPHQCTFIKSLLFCKLGEYCTDYKIVSDWIFWYRAVTEQNVTIKSVDILISIMQPNGISISPDGRQSEVIRFLMSRKDEFTVNDWREIVERCNKAYQLTCATRSKLGRLLVRIAKFINK